MSPDEILASNLWPWPDPLLKRDRQGRILFVNAAFLQLYGGRIEDWAGQIINGWPQPVPQGAQRFETRVGETPAESVFDWVEMVMADGNAMAIARNVTALMAPPQPPIDKEPVPQPMQQQPAPAQTAPAQTAPAQAVVQPEPAPALALNTQIETPEVNPIETAPSLEGIQDTPAQTSANKPVFESEPESQMAEKPVFEDTLNNNADDYSYEVDDNSQQQHQNAPVADEEVVSAAPVLQPVVETQASPAPERRTLPIEDSAAVLGNNWRDQVIAKAVGAEAPETQPVTSAQKSPLENADQGKPAAALNILLAEDNAINALLTRTLLEAEGAIVDVVEDGALAVEAARNNKYDLIFMDMRMPNMDGLESTRKIRSLGGQLGRIPIIALTANAFDDDRNACFDSGMNDFMTKPVSAEELSEMVINWTKDQVTQKLAS